jgi:hypothetical protein
MNSEAAFAVGMRCWRQKHLCIRSLAAVVACSALMVAAVRVPGSSGWLLRQRRAGRWASGGADACKYLIYVTKGKFIFIFLQFNTKMHWIIPSRADIL